MSGFAMQVHRHDKEMTYMPNRVHFDRQQWRADDKWLDLKYQIANKSEKANWFSPIIACLKYDLSMLIYWLGGYPLKYYPKAFIGRLLKKANL